MVKKDKKLTRTVAPRILYVLKGNKNNGMRFNEIFKAMAEKGWLHSQRPISQNLKYLIAEKKIIHIKNSYGFIQTRENGSKFAIVNDPVEKIVEL